MALLLAEENQGKDSRALQDLQSRCLFPQGKMSPAREHQAEAVWCALLHPNQSNAEHSSQPAYVPAVLVPAPVPHVGFHQGLDE